MPIISVPAIPNAQPEWWNALGIAKIPVPRDPFKRCNSVSIFLQGKKVCLSLIAGKKER